MHKNKIQCLCVELAFSKQKSHPLLIRRRRVWEPILMSDFSINHIQIIAYLSQCLDFPFETPCEHFVAAAPIEMDYRR